MLTFSAQNSTNDVLSNSSKWFHDTVKRRSMLILAGAERVKEWLVTAYQLQCKLAALNFLLETSSCLKYRLQSHSCKCDHISNLLFLVQCRVWYGTHCIYFQGDFAAVRY